MSGHGRQAGAVTVPVGLGIATVQALVVQAHGGLKAELAPADPADDFPTLTGVEAMTPTTGGSPACCGRHRCIHGCPDGGLAAGVAVAEPLVDVGLGAVADGAPVRVEQPGEELEDFGDLLFDGQHGAGGGLVSGGVVTDPLQVVPGCEELDWASDRGFADLGEPLVQPPLEAYQVGVVWR